MHMSFHYFIIIIIFGFAVVFRLILYMRIATQHRCKKWAHLPFTPNRFFFVVVVYVLCRPNEVPKFVVFSIWLGRVDKRILQNRCSTEGTIKRSKVGLNSTDRLNTTPLCSSFSSSASFYYF